MSNCEISRIGCALAFFALIGGCSRDPLQEQISLLSDPDVTVRRAAARTLRDQRYSDERVVKALTDSAGDSDMEVRFLSIDALGQAGPKAKPSLSVLKSALADSDKRVRQEAALAIPKIDPTDTSFQAVLINAMREGDGRTLLAVSAMGESAAWAVPTLTGILSHADPKVRVLAARALGRVGPAATAGKPALEAASRDSNAAVQKAAKDALARIESKLSPGAK
jgi:HEAT repeat protein